MSFNRQTSTIHNETTRPNENKFLTIIEAAQFLNLKLSRLRYLVFKKLVPHFKIGRSIMFSTEDLISWMISKKREPQRCANE